MCAHEWLTNHPTHEETEDCPKCPKCGTDETFVSEYNFGLISIRFIKEIFEAMGITEHLEKFKEVLQDKLENPPDNTVSVSFHG